MDARPQFFVLVTGDRSLHDVPPPRTRRASLSSGSGSSPVASSSSSNLDGDAESSGDGDADDAGSCASATDPSKSCESGLEARCEMQSVVQFPCQNEELLDMFQQELLTDFEVVTPADRSIKTHRVVLAAVSPFFRALLQDSFVETVSQRVVLSCADPYELLPAVIASFYSGVLCFEPPQAVGVLAIGTFLGVSCIKEQAMDFIRANMIRGRLCGQYLQDAIRLELLVTLQHLSEIVCKNFSKLVHQQPESFLGLDPDFLYSMLSNERHLKVAAEVHLARFVQVYIQCRSSELSDAHIAKLTRLVRFTFLPNHYLVSLAEESSPFSEDVVMSALRRRMMLLSDTPVSPSVRLPLQMHSMSMEVSRESYVGIDNGVPGGPVSSLQDLLRAGLLDESEVVVKASGLQDTSTTRGALLQYCYPGIIFCTDNNPDCFVEFRLPSHSAVRLTEYGFRHGAGSLFASKRRMRNWDIWGLRLPRSATAKTESAAETPGHFQQHRGSTPDPGATSSGGEWCLLRAHRNDMTVQQSDVDYRWRIHDRDRRYQGFRVACAGAYPDYSQNFWICLSAFNVYGSFVCLE